MKQKDNHTIKSQSIKIEEGDIPLTIPSAAKLMHISISTLYKLTSTNQIPHFKPGGKIIYILKSDCLKYMLRNKVHSKSEIQNFADDYLANNFRK